MNKANETPANSGKDPKVLAAAREVAEQVGREILESRLDPGAWAIALAESKGRKQEALAAYTRIREGEEPFLRDPADRQVHG